MEKIIITATQQKVLSKQLPGWCDRIYVGEKDFGLRLPTAFSHEELLKSQMAFMMQERCRCGRASCTKTKIKTRIKPFLDFF